MQTTAHRKVLSEFASACAATSKELPGATEHNEESRRSGEGLIVAGAVCVVALLIIVAACAQ